MLVHFLRHGQTTSDIEDRYGGDYEDHLTEHGREQVTQRLKRLPVIKAIVSSPRVRAQETADMVARHVHVPVHTERAWRERNVYGMLTGMRKEDAQQQYPGYAEQVKDYRNTIPEAESYEEFKERILKALQDLVHKKQTDVLIATHGGPIKCILRELFNCELKELHDCALLSLQYTASGWHFVSSDGIVFASTPPARKPVKQTAPPYDSWRGSTY